MTSLLKVEGLTRTFGAGCPQCADRTHAASNHCPRCGTVYALDGVSFDVRPHEVLGIVGESGSGKSTLMKCLSFDQTPTAGSLFLDAFDDGRSDVWAASDQLRRRLRHTVLGMVYQNPADGLKMGFSAMANIAEKLIAAGERRVKTMEDRALELLDHVNIPLARRHEPPSRFSGGMQQRVQIAKALSSRPPLLLLDEVTTGLDLSVQAKVLDLIRRLKRELGIGMVLVSHDLGVIRMLADRTLVLLGGRVVEEGLTDQILEDPQHAYTQELVQSLL
jgi:putative phosphonate transport system ATP-binding protein